jgi:hypothetical protein
MKRRFLMIRFSCLCVALLFGVTACAPRHAGRYGDVSISYPGATINKATGEGCDASGNITKQNNPHCVGKTVASDRNSPTITVLAPSHAMPVEAVDSATLAPPSR